MVGHAAFETWHDHGPFQSEPDIDDSDNEYQSGISGEDEDGPWIGIGQLKND